MDRAVAFAARVRFAWPSICPSYQPGSILSRSFNPPLGRLVSLISIFICSSACFSCISKQLTRTASRLANSSRANPIPMHDVGPMENQRRALETFQDRRHTVQKRHEREVAPCTSATRLETPFWPGLCRAFAPELSRLVDGSHNDHHIRAFRNALLEDARVLPGHTFR